MRHVMRAIAGLCTVLWLCAAQALFAQGAGSSLSQRAQPTVSATVQGSAEPIQVQALSHGVPEREVAGDLIEVRGLVYDDANGNGTREVDEPALKGISIQSEALDDALGRTRIASTAVTDARGQFTLIASTRTLLTVLTPDGWRAIGPVTRFATGEIAFGLRQERIAVERVFTLAPDLKVDVAVPPPAPVRVTLDQTTQVTGAALVLGVFGLAVALLLTLALWAHGRARVKAALQPELARAARARLDDATWPLAVEQVLSDAGVPRARVERFLGMGSGAGGGWMRFSDQDGRCYTLATGRRALHAAGVSGGRWLGPGAHAVALAQLRAVWRHFAGGAAHAQSLTRALPECAHWWLAVDPQPASHLSVWVQRARERAQITRDRLRGRQRVRMLPIASQGGPTS